MQAFARRSVRILPKSVLQPCARFRVLRFKRETCSEQMFPNAPMILPHRVKG